MFENFKERLLSAQQDFSSGLKTLGDKSKEVKIKKPSSTDGLPKFAAGAELLSKYENTWAALHKRTEECAKVGEVVDGKIVVLSAYWEKRRNQLSELQEQLEQIPALLVGLDALTSKLGKTWTACFTKRAETKTICIYGAFTALKAIKGTPQRRNQAKFNKVIGDINGTKT
ncbi:dysbindin-like [Rhincodon typus]|uniref:dysbindin-like n=1 Tax=Rhincodon typus TaxID=259920 RepID=UPI00202FCB17|nr:dysbindin-like [Rhincodon typus]